MLQYMMMGVGLSAACGFRVFVPLLVASIGHQTGNVELGADFEWIGSWPALITFGTASVLEVGSYYVPWIDNALDAVAGPAAVVAGTVMTAAFIPEMSPMLEWTLALLVGGGSAGVVQAGTTIARGASTATTGGVGNPVVSTAELGGSVLTAVLAIVLPIIAAILIAVIFFFAFRTIFRFFSKKKAHPPEAPPATP